MALGSIAYSVAVVGMAVTARVDLARVGWRGVNSHCCGAVQFSTDHAFLGRTYQMVTAQSAYFVEPEGSRVWCRFGSLDTYSVFAVRFRAGSTH